MYIKSRGIVIKQSDSGEKGKLLTILTEDRGVVRAKAAGGKNVKASYFRCVQLFTYCEFQFCTSANGGMLTVVDAVYIRSFFDLSQDIERFALASYCTEICKASIVGDATDKEIVALLLNTFHTLVKGSLPTLHVKAVYEIRLACLLGYAPSLLECDACGKPLPKEESKTFFDNESCSVCCEDCVSDGAKLGVTEMSAAVYRSVLHSVVSEKNSLFSFRTDEKTLAEFSELTEKYILRRLEFQPKSLPLYKSFRVQSLRKER